MVIDRGPGAKEKRANGKGQSANTKHQRARAWQRVKGDKESSIRASSDPVIEQSREEPARRDVARCTSPRRGTSTQPPEATPSLHPRLSTRCDGVTSTPRQRPRHAEAAGSPTIEPNPTRRGSKRPHPRVYVIALRTTDTRQARGTAHLARGHTAYDVRLGVSPEGSPPGVLVLGFGAADRRPAPSLRADREAGVRSEGVSTGIVAAPLPPG